MARNKKKPASALLASLTRALLLSVFLCLPAAYSMAADNIAAQSEPAAISPVTAEEDRPSYAVLGYVALSCENGPNKHPASTGRKSEGGLTQETAGIKTAASEGPEKNQIELAQNAQETVKFKEGVFIKLPLLPQAPFVPADCAYSAELDEVLTAMSAATTAPLITTRGLHKETPELSNARPFPMEDPAPIKNRSLERFFAKHTPPMPISIALASCPATEFAMLPALRVPKAEPIATIAPVDKPITVKTEQIKKPFEPPFVSEALASCGYAEFINLPVMRTEKRVPLASIAPAEKPVIVKTEPIKKPFEPPFVSEVLASCGYAEFINLPVMRTEKRVPLASIAPAEKPVIVKTEPIKKSFEPPFVSEVLASCEYAEFINLPVMRTEKRVPLASIAPAAPATEKTYVATLPKTDNLKIKPKAAPTQPAARPDDGTSVAEATQPKQAAPGVKLTKITPIAPETVESMPRQLLQEQRPALAKQDQTAPKAESRPSVPMTSAPISKPQAAVASKTPPEDNRIVVAKLAPSDTMPRVEPVKPQPPKAAPIEKLPPGYQPPDITRGDIDEKRVSITFDGGSEDADAAIILDTLKSRGIKATVFLTGEFIQKYKDVVRAIVAQGHEVGNHTMTHPHLTTFETNRRHKTIQGVTKATLKAELRGAADAFKAVTGLEMAPIWRAPYGEVNEELRKWAFDEGYVHIGWTTDRKAKQSLDTLDWVADRKSKLYRSASEIKRRLLSFGEDNGGVNGGIVLMHLGTLRTVDRASEMLGDIIDELSMQGYQIVNISSLMRGHAALDAVYRMRKERVLSGVAIADEGQPSAKSKAP